jgi:hypothetical protein
VVAARQTAWLFRADRELDTSEQAFPGDLAGDVAGVHADPDLPDPLGQAGQSATQQPDRAGPGIIVARQQVRRHRHPQFGPEHDVRAVGALSLVVVGAAPLGSSVDLHIGGIHI